MLNNDWFNSGDELFKLTIAVDVRGLEELLWEMTSECPKIGNLLTFYLHYNVK